MSAIDDVINTEEEYEITSEMRIADWKPHDAFADLSALRVTNATQAERIAALENAVTTAHIAMIAIGNDLNWEPPANQQLADAINLCANHNAPTIAEACGLTVSDVQVKAGKK